MSPLPNHTMTRKELTQAVASLARKQGYFVQTVRDLDSLRQFACTEWCARNGFTFAGVQRSNRKDFK